MRQDVDLPVRSGNKETIDDLENSVTENETSKNVHVEIEGNADCFLYIIGMVMVEWVPPGQAVNHQYYLEVLAKLTERVRREAQVVEEQLVDSPSGQWTMTHKHMSFMNTN